MTEQQVARAQELIHARNEIQEFLEARNPDSALVRECLESKYEYQREKGKRIPTAKYVAIDLIDANRPYDEDVDTLSYWHIARDIMERALMAELPRIVAELASLGVSVEPVAMVKTDPELVGKPKPANCTIRLRGEGSPAPKSGCAICGDGGMLGCPYDAQRDTLRATP